MAGSAARRAGAGTGRLGRDAALRAKPACDPEPDAEAGNSLNVHPPEEFCMKSQTVLPVLLSMAIIILVAILEKQSKLFAALAAVMPLGAPLALWIVYASNGGDRTAVSQFSLSLLLGLLPTLAFLVAVWLAARAGLKLGPMLLAGYGVWIAGAAILYMLRGTLGIR